jgi:hypothetical protein
MTRSIASAICSVVLLASACGGDNDVSDETGTEQATAVEEAESSTTTAAETTTTVEETTTTVETEETPAATSEAGIPETPVATFLNQAYLFGSEQGPASTDQLPFPVNTVTAHWYQSDGFYVVVYGALAPEQMLCPGNSIQTSSGFEFVSNAPLGGADCSFAPVVAEAPNGVVTCNRVVSYVTLIPAGTEGNLFGTVEMMTDGLGVGLTSQVLADPVNMPEIDRSSIDC